MVIARGTGPLIVMLSVLVVEPLSVCAFTVNVLVWTRVGFPETIVDCTPYDFAIVNPSGSEPETMLNW